MSPAAPRAEPLFLDTPGGARFCLYHPPHGAARAALLYLHPFAEEMNKSRRMAALAARRLAARGVGVLQLDLHGCGDSAGEFREARWDGWQADVKAGLEWLQARLGLVPGLWGLRLGALLALDYAALAAQAPARLLLWQPVLSGAQHLNQFLRLRVAGAMLHEGGGSGGASGGTSGGTAALRARLQAGELLEIGGYELHPALALALDGIDAARLAAPRCRIDWFEVVPEAGRMPPAAATRLAEAWRAGPSEVHLTALPGPAFWSTQEIAEAPALLDASAGVYPDAA